MEIRQKIHTMSEPKRYKLRPIFWDYTQKKSVSRDQIDAMGNESAYSHADGDWVKWDDYASLEAKVDELKEEVTYQKQKAQEMVEFICECVAKGEFKAFKNGSVKFGKTGKPRA